MFDVIIVGARCAGAPLAMLLSRRSYRVLLVDKARFPSDTTSTHLVWQAGLARAKRWGLLDRILRLNAPIVHTVRLDVGEFEIAGQPPPLNGIDYAVAPRRFLLDKLLVDAAAEAGVEVRQSFYVSEILQEGGRVVGIRGHTSRGAVIHEHARMVVGADGVHSLVAHSTKAAKYEERGSAGSAYYTYWRGGPAVTDFVTYARAGWGAALIPTNNELTCIVAGWTHSFVGSKSRPEDCYSKCMERVPQLMEFLTRGEQAEPLLGMRELPGYFRKPWGDGWALAGDAGYHKHPLSAQGITDAFRDADLLAEAIDAGLSGRRPLVEALSDYERERNETVMPQYESTSMRALMEPFPPEFMALFRALRNNQEEADSFFGTDAGTVSMAEFFAPQNVQRIVSSTSSAQAGRAGG